MSGHGLSWYRGHWFAAMYEDPALELALMPRRGSIICIASAGCTALALTASGRQVLAVDSNPAQIAVLRERLAGRSPPPGRADRALAGLRTTARLLGIPASRLRCAALAEDPRQRQAAWRAIVEPARCRLLRDWIDHGLLPCLFRGRPAGLPADFSRVLSARIGRRLGRPGVSAAAARWLLAGIRPPLPPGARMPETATADVLQVLHQQPSGSVAGISLSNICDGGGADPQAVAAAIRHAAEPSGMVIVRSIAAAEDAAEASWAERDGSLLWGRILVGEPAQVAERLQAAVCRAPPHPPEPAAE